jgi:YVTN family beta-propeller protein
VNADSNAVAQVDPHTNSIVRTVTVGNDPTGISFGNGLLWVSAADGTVTCIDPASATVARTIQVGGSPQDVVAAYGRVWEAVS